MTVVGLDLAGSPARPTGCCIFRGAASLRASIVHSDPEILSVVATERPDLVVIDAPLSLPRGRRSIEDRNGPHLRECDRELQRLGIRFFPLTLGPMRMLTERGMRLGRAIAQAGVPVIEGYPGGAQDLLGIPRKQAGTELLQRRLRAEGLRGDLARRPLSHDELDAVTIAWVGRMHLSGRSLVLGDPEEGLMLLPEPRPNRTARPATGSSPVRKMRSAPRGR